jgi:HlyB family type I secretion system ABC transporter
MTPQPAWSAAHFLRQIPSFRDLHDDQIEELAALCELRARRKDAAIVGTTPWSGAGIVLTGTARIVDERVPGESAAVHSLSAGALFAQESLFSADPFPYVVYASSDCAVLLLTKDRCDEWLATRAAVSRQMREAAARHSVVEFLSGALPAVPPEEIARLAGSMRERRLVPGEILARAGRPPESFFLVRSGRLRIVHDSGTAAEVLEPGGTVGDLVNPLPLEHDIVAAADCLVYVIPIAQKAADSSPAEPAAEAQADAELRWQSPLHAAPRRRLNRHPVVRQQSVMDCGAACLATVCSYYGKRVNLNRVRDLSRVGANGASMLHLLQAAEQLGFESIPMLATMDHLRANHLPAIVNWKGYHWIVVYGVGERHVRVADPAGGLLKMPLAEFEEGWTRYTLYLRPTPAFADVEESPRTLKQFTPYLRPYRVTLFEIGLASLAIQVLALLLPAFTKFIIDDVIVKQHDQWLRAALFGIAAAVALQWAAARSRQQLLLLVAQRVNLRLLGDFYRHVLSLPLPFFERRKVGDIVSRLDENTKLTTFFTNTGIEVVIDAVMAVFYLALMLHYNGRLTAVCSAVLCLHILNVYVITPRLQQGYRLVFQRGAEMHSHTIESLDGLATIRALGIDHYVRWTWENLLARFTNAYFSTLKYGIASGLASQLSNTAGEVAVLFYGASLVMRNELTVGGLVAFTILFHGLMSPATKLVGSWDRLQEALNAVERLNDVYDSAPESGDEPGEDLAALPPLNGHIRFEGVTFRYEPDGRNVLQNINLEIHMGQRVAFVGRSGSGKSTLVKLLLGFYTPTGGRILVDGFDLARAWLPSLRRQIGVVPQDSFLFRGTIRDNIVHSRPEATPVEVELAAQLADAHGFIARLPLGYETPLEEKASNLSGGQKQRIAIARVLLQQPRMLLLDEATSALDNESERRFMQNLDEAFSSQTTIMIAHRLSTVRKADLIVVLDQGNIVEQGTHEQLMQRRGLYSVLCAQQLNL